MNSVRRSKLRIADTCMIRKQRWHSKISNGLICGRRASRQTRKVRTAFRYDRAEAVEIAGGFHSQAKHSQVVLFRRVNNDLSKHACST